MTLEEKVRMVVGTAKGHPNPPMPAPGTFQRPPKGDDDQSTYQTKTKVPGAAGDSYPISRIGIPSIVYADGPAGVRIDSVRENDNLKYNATAFPIATLLASSWDLELVRKVGEAMGNEALEYGVDIILAPGMNIHRNPLTGRNFEYYSEDPVLSGKMAAAMVNGIQFNGVGASIKHFAVNNQETYRNGIDVIVDERTLREIYLKGFEIAIKESDPWTIMSSYNKINGDYASESTWLLTDLLRDEWGYQGFVMTDWWAEYNPVNQMKAGNDLIMPGTEEQIQELISAVKSGKLDERILDKNISNILSVIKRTPTFNRYQYTNKPDLTKHASIVRRSAAEGMVLLENKNHTLPLNKNIKNVALLGVSSYDVIVGGYGSGYVYRPHKISLDKGLTEAGYVIDQSTSKAYAEYIKQQKEILPQENFWHVATIPEMEVKSQDITRLAELNDIAIISVSRNSGEGDDRKLEKGDYYLTDIELEQIKHTVSAFRKEGKKTIVVLNIGGVIEMTDWKDIPDAILLAWQPGQKAGYSITDILTGEISPSGRLATTFPAKYEDVPSARNFPKSEGNPSMVKYEEGIYIGYRYYNTFKVAPTYPFGYGLSYTDFNYTDFQLDKNVFDGKITVTFNVTNSGKIQGKEVVQLYVNAPGKELEKPIRELKVFFKTKLLQPGESQKISFSLTNEELASYNPSVSAWSVEKGQYQMQICRSSDNIIRRLDFTVADGFVLE